MKKGFLYIPMIALMALGFTSCIRDDYYEPQPNYNTYNFTDNFNDNYNNWEFVDDVNDADGYISNGTYKINYFGTNSPAYYVSKKLSFNTNNDFTIYSRIGSDNNMGLLFGYNSNNDSTYGYSFMVDYDGYYALYDEGGNGYGAEVYQLIAPKTGNFVNANGGWNDLRIDQIQDRWIGYVNDVKVFDIPAQQLLGRGVGFVDVANTQGEVDYLEVDGYQY